VAPGIVLPVVSRAQIYAKCNTNRSPHYFRNKKIKEKMLGGFNFLVERTHMISWLMAKFHHLPSKKSGLGNFPQKNLDFERYFSLPNPFEVAIAERFFKPFVH
jgi:hypothetical protein